MPRNPDRPISLTQWIHGRVRVHFRSGHIADLPMSLRTAHSLRKQLEDKQGADSIGGLHAHSGWLWARHDEVVLTEWEPAVDYGWRDISVEERPRLEALAMPHGVLSALAELWESKHRHRAAYSINAIAALHTIATKEANVTRGVWDRMAEMLEGEKGAQLAKPGVIGKTRPMAQGQQPDEVVEDRHVVPSDDTEVDEAAGSSEASGTADVDETRAGSESPETDSVRDVDRGTEDR
jgi:hypothetical protein